MDNNDDFLQEREWVPLWLAGPILAIMAVIGCIALVRLGIVLYDLAASVIK